MRIAIVGGGVTGGNAAVTLREEGFDGDVVLFGDEPGLPFGRPPLSKEYMRGEGDVWTVQPQDWYADNGVDLRTSARVARVDPPNARLVLTDGTDVACDRVLVATGCRPRVPSSMPGVNLDGVVPLRTRAQSDEIREAAKRPGAHVVVAGMSFIGAEVTASLRQMGAEVTSVFSGPGPLSAVLGLQLAQRLTKIHRDRGVELVADEKVVSLEGSGSVEAVVTSSGRRIDCTLAVLGLGVEPNVDLLEDTGVALDNGVLVDERCRTNVEAVFAAGDVANHRHPIFGRIRVEHFNNAEKQARHAARSILGSEEPYDYLHSFWSDQYDHHIDYVGWASGRDTFVPRADDGSGGLLGFYVSDGIVKAAVGLDRGGDPEAEPDSELAASAQLIRAGKPVDPQQLIEGDLTQLSS